MAEDTALMGGSMNVAAIEPFSYPVGETNHAMKVSVVIPTFHRPRDLGTCLDSILAQTLLPWEVLVVDNGADAASEALIYQRQRSFAATSIQLRYLLNARQNSLTAARNLGVKQTTGEIVMFLDDDVILDSDYVREIVRVYDLEPNALGVQGFLVHEPRPMRDFFFRLFYWNYLERNKCRVLPSITATYPLELDRARPCECLSGANHSFRRTVFNEFQYDERLIKYSDGEDLELTYRVFSRYPGSLFITPSAKLVHNTSMQARASGKELVYMREVYGLYLFFKLFSPTLKNKLKYVWSRVGRLAFSLTRLVLGRPSGSMVELQYLVGAYCLCLRHAVEIKYGELAFFNETLE